MVDFAQGRTALSPEKNRQLEVYRQRFAAALSADLNLPQALALVWQVVKSNLPNYDKYDLLLDFDQILGLGLGQIRIEEVPVKIYNLVGRRETARQAQNWILADQLRRQIEKLGWQIQDTQAGPKMRKR
jgi:cysteinyl-tRNA synthetase